MGYFPFFVDIENKTGLIVGGGSVAARKIKKLLPFKPKLKVIAPKIHQVILDLEKENDNLECFLRGVESEDIEGAHFVIAASDNQELNSRISDICNEKNIPVNVIDDKDKCGFIFPSLIHEGALTVGISTEGSSPTVAATIKNETAKAVPADIEKILDYLSGLRDMAKENISDSKIRSEFLKNTAKECMEKNCIFNEEETRLRIDAYIHNKMPDTGMVSLVGAGCGAFDLITLKGIRAVRNAQVLVYDDLIDDRLLEYTAESCEKIYVGKRSGKHSMKQQEINELLIKKAKEGRYVVRLKGGDPFVFGRGGEEILALQDENIKTEYIPGVTSSIAVPGFAGIPVTHRGESRSFHVITGHTAMTSDSLPENMETIAKLKGTLVFLMGYGHLEAIANELIANGKSKDTPAAVIHGGTDNTADEVRGSLGNIAKLAKNSDIKTPAIIVVGDVAKLKL
jgi:uroporphyrin-III C-methyltransferase/precorrin-2 dehydrogenase/sirohydrochlorin ferrochelatase